MTKCEIFSRQGVFPMRMFWATVPGMKPGGRFSTTKDPAPTMLRTTCGRSGLYDSPETRLQPFAEPH
jgi:hypothetical protein